MKDLQYKPPPETSSSSSSPHTRGNGEMRTRDYALAGQSTGRSATSSTSSHAIQSRQQQQQQQRDSADDSIHNASSGSSTLFHPLNSADTHSPANSNSNTTTTTPGNTATLSTSSITTSSATRPSNPRTRSSSSMSSLRSNASHSSVTNAPTSSANKLATTSASSSSSISHHANPASSPGGSAASKTTIHEDEIEASLRQWRNHVFPSLKAGNYVSPGQETPDKDPIHPLIEPILPCIFASTPKTSSSLSSADTNRETGINNEKKGFNKIGTNFKAIPVIYENGKQFLDSIIQVSNGSRLRPGTTRDDSISNLTAETKTEGEPPKPEMEENVDSDDEEEEEEDYQSNWRLEMVLGQTRDLINTNENAEGIWIALWSGEAANGSRLLEFCLMKLPSRPLVISSPIPISLLPTALLQDRMQILLNAYLSLPIIKSNPSPFSLVMGPTRVVEAFLLHYDSHPGLLHNSNSISGNNGRFNANGNHLGGHNDRAEEGMFEQSIIQLDQSPYPLKLSHPKYTAASQKRAAAAAASAPPSGGNDHAAAGISINKDQNRARAESSGVPSTPNFTSSSSLSSLSASSALAAGNETGTSPAKSVNITHATPASQPHTTGHVNDSSNESSLTIPQPSSSTSSTTTAMQHHRYNAQQYNQYNQRQMFHHSAAAGRTVKPLLHTRAKDIPPAVSLSEGFAVRLADEKDDLRTLVSLFQAYSRTLDHTLEENAARRALQKAMSNKSVWIYHIYSQSLPGLSLIAGFLTTERKRPYTGPPSTICSKSNGGKGKGSVAITAVFTEEAFRSRGVAESLVRTSTRYYLVDLEYDYVSVYVDPRNETTCRVFSRVGYGIMDREVKEEIPVKLIRDALHAQWEEEKARQQTLLEEEEDQEEQREVNAQLGQNDDEVDDTIHSYGVECDRSASLSTSYKASTHERSIESARDALSLLSAANAQIQANTEAHQAQAQSSNQAPKASSEAPARRASNATSAGSPINITTPNTESGNLIPTAEENEAALQAENGKPLCTSVEEWQVVSLKSREVALMESRSRVRGHARRDDSKRLSSEGPWH